METTAPQIEDLWPCFQGIIPTALSTCSRDGTPNITFLSQVYYIDATHVAISFQFFNKTHKNVRENPLACAMILDPGTSRPIGCTCGMTIPNRPVCCSSRCPRNCRPSRPMRG
ncbi:MAG TPA: pyridoxamine 5'-phosphate oxidase family protein [Nitrospiraceae bacterium]|jgi:hypothetical protein|nr:pyridoxamine 5'-phosphate oxidase family protein [Nitrospiraceae bacterium]